MTPLCPSLFLLAALFLPSGLRGAFLVKISEFLRRGFCNRERRAYREPRRPRRRRRRGFNVRDADCLDFKVRAICAGARLEQRDTDVIPWTVLRIFFHMIRRIKSETIFTSRKIEMEL